MKEHDVAARDRLAAAFDSEDSVVTLTVPIVKSSGDDSIDIMPSPKQSVLSLLLPLFQFTFLGKLLPMYLVTWHLA